jgi:hypothetical protein
VNSKVVFHYAQYIYNIVDTNYWSPLTINLSMLLLSPQLYSSSSSFPAPLLFAHSTSSKSSSSSTANNLPLTSSLLRTQEFCSIGCNFSVSSWTSSSVSLRCSSSLPIVKHCNLDLSSASETTLVSLGSFQRTTFQLDLSTSSAKNTCWTWKGNTN